MASVIANEFSEATSDLHRSALIEIGLALFLVTIAVNGLAPPAGVGGDTRRTGEGYLMTNAPLRQSKARSSMRAATDHLASGLAILATILVVAPLVAIFAYLLIKGFSSLNLAFFTQIPKPRRGEWRWYVQCHRGFSRAAWTCQPYRHSDRHRGRHLSRRGLAAVRLWPTRSGLRRMC